jgi:tetratricopeptide (TPR) repeat protein
MKQILLITLTALFYSFTYGQNVTELFNKKDFQELVKLENKSRNLTAEELYMVGFAFFQTENDNKAIEFFDKAIGKGLNNGLVYFYKGVSYYYLKKYEDALKQNDIALQKEPTNQEFMNQKGQIYRLQGEEEKALEFFEKATKLPNTSGEPFFWVAYIYHGKQDFKKALPLYYIALDSVSQNNSYYQTTLESIGQLEYTFTKDYKKSAIAYEKAIELDNENYELYYKLLKSYNSDKNFKKADSVFQIVKTAYKNKKLPKEDMEFKAVSIAQFEWNGQIATIRKSLEDAKEILDITYKVFVQDKENTSVERRFVVEKTIQFEKNGANFLLCEQDKKTGGHITYPYGWLEENINTEDLEKAVKLILDGKMKQGASSNFNKN